MNKHTASSQSLLLLQDMICSWCWSFSHKFLRCR